MKKFIIEKIVIPFLIVMPLLAVLLVSWDIFQRNEGIKEACRHLGGIYINSDVCIQGSNLFIEGE